MLNISSEQLALLESVAKKSASSATQALSKLIGAPVTLEMLRARTINVSELTSILATPEKQVSAIVLPVGGEGTGSSALIASLSDNYHLAELITKKSFAAGEPLDAQAVSALKETSNIIGGAFLSSLSNTVGMSLLQSVPELIEKTMQEVIDATINKIPDGNTEKSVAFEIDFSLKITTTTETIVAHYLFILELAFAQKLLGALRKRASKELAY